MKCRDCEQPASPRINRMGHAPIFCPSCKLEHRRVRQRRYRESHRGKIKLHGMAVREAARLGSTWREVLTAWGA